MYFSKKKQIHKILLGMLGKNQMCCIGRILCLATYNILVLFILFSFILILYGLMYLFCFILFF